MGEVLSVLQTAQIKNPDARIVLAGGDQGMLLDLLAQLSAEEKRPIQVLECRGQAPDHPVSATCPETRYLKCLTCRVG